MLDVRNGTYFFSNPGLKRNTFLSSRGKLVPVARGRAGRSPENSHDVRCLVFLSLRAITRVRVLFVGRASKPHLFEGIFVCEAPHRSFFRLRHYSNCCCVYGFLCARSLSVKPRCDLQFEPTLTNWPQKHKNDTHPRPNASLAVPTPIDQTNISCRDAHSGEKLFACVSARARGTLAPSSIGKL